MATKTFDELKQLAIQIRDEKTNKQNTANRVGAAMLEAINKLEQDYYDKTNIDEQSKNTTQSITSLDTKIDKRTTEYNVSVNNPTSGTSGTNRYDLAGAIAQVPAELRTAGLKVSFINSAGKPESWKYQGGSWAVANFIQESSGGNKILTWVTDAATTRKQVSVNERKAGMQISYTSDGENWTNEQFIGNSTDDTSWADDSNWVLLPNETYIKDLYGGYVDTSEFLMCYTDSEGRFLFGIKYDGSIEWSKGVPTPIQDALSKIRDFIYCQTINSDILEMIVDNDDRILSYRDNEGVKHEEKLDANIFYHKGKKINNVADLDDIPSTSDIPISELDGVQYHQLENLFDKNDIKTYDSDFADKVYSAIGRKTDSTGCYSNLIPCKNGDWFTRNDFGTGIVVVLDKYGNILGDVANAAYMPTVQITPSKQEYDFTNAEYVSFVVQLANIDSEIIVKKKYIPTGEGEYLTIPMLKIQSENVDKDMVSYIKSTSGRYYSLKIDDSGDSPILSPVLMEGIPMSELPNDFPMYSIQGDFSEYYDSLVLCPIQGKNDPYLYELASNGLVKRYIKQTLNCPRILKENGEWYFYGVSGGLSLANGELNIYKRNGETFELVRGNLRNSKGNLLEPHDCYVISVNPVHYICQRWVWDYVDSPSGGEKIQVLAPVIEEVYEGQSVWEWKSTDYPDLFIDSLMDYGDYMHNNTISLDKDGNLCLNPKMTNQILVIKRTWNEESHTGTIGEILWKIGGNIGNSGWDVPNRIKTTEQQQWHQCHDAIVNDEGLWTLYDNENGPANPSRIVEFNVDTESKTITDYKGFEWEGRKSLVMGSVDRIKSGVYLVSWGGTRNGSFANVGIYDFNANKAICEIKFNDEGSSAYRVYGIPKE